MSSEIYFFPYPGLGDFIMASPFFNAAINEHKERKHILIVRNDCRFTNIIKEFIPFDRVLIFDKKNYWNRLRLFFRLRKINVDVIVNFHHSSRFIPFFKMISKKVFSSHDLNTIHPYEISEKLLKKMDIKAHNLKICVNLPSNAEKKAEDWLLENNMVSKDFFMFIPGSFDEKRRYSIDRWKKIAGFLMDKYPGKSIIANLGPWEKELEKELSEFGIRVFTGKDISTLAGLIHKSLLVISNDTGPLHLAYSLDKKCIGLMKRNGHRTSHPYSQYAKALYPQGNCNLDCDNCSIKCVEDISKDDIIDAIKSQFD